MPELPEVETFRKFFLSHALHKKILKVDIPDKGILIDITQEDEILKKTEQEEFIDSYRHGKYLFLKLSTENWILIHFGMSGYLRYCLESETPHKHDRVIFHFTDKHYLSFNCMRKFGNIQSVSTPEHFIMHHKFGPDANSITLKQFLKQIQTRKRPIKSAILSQNIIAGVGNLYADEALYQAKILPQTQCTELSENQLILLHSKIRGILQIAIKQKADYGIFPKDFFIHYRKKEGKCPKCKTFLSRMTITQRTTYFCSKCQKKGEKSS